jgi:protocatechuate 3,4-dioxygenase beta subunit
MENGRAIVCFFALSLSALTASAQPAAGVGPSTPVGQPPRDGRQAAGQAAIKGRVVAVDSGQPVRRAEVRVSAAELRVPRAALTDADGRYEIRDLAAGHYSIRVTRSPFIAWSYGETQPDTSGTPVAVADGQTAEHIDIRLFRGAVITGRITDDFGEAVPGARVTLMRPQFRRGERTLAAATSATTNDLGEYRMFGLSPGQYYVSALSPQPGLMMGPAADDDADQAARSGYAPTFYPGTAAAASAQKLTVGLAQTLSGIDVALVAARTATISGTAVDSQGRPIPGVVQIRPHGVTAGLGAPGSLIQPDGTFSIPNVYPGDYALLVNGPRGPQGIRPPDDPPGFALAYVTVNGEDVTGVQLIPVTPVSLAGRVSFDDQDAAQRVKPSAVRVATLAATVGDAGLGIGSGGNLLPVNDDLTFVMKTTPGRMAIRATAPGWLVKAIRVNGRDVTDTDLDVGGQGLTGVDIEMTHRRQDVSGSVKDASGAPVANAVVLIFAQDRARWTAPMRRYEERTRADADGRFNASSLPPGDYYAVAIDHTDTIEGQDPELLESLIGDATSFALAPGGSRILDLQLVTPH